MSITPKIKPVHLLDDASTDISSSSYSVWGPRLAFQLSGTWDGATVTADRPAGTTGTTGAAVAAGLTVSTGPAVAAVTAETA